MKIQFASDLHLERIEDDPTFIGFGPAPGADVLVLAGDIGNGTDWIDRFKDWPVPVIYVHGNHDVWMANDLDSAINDMRNACEGTSIVVLEKDDVAVGGVRFIGTALWTDYLYHGLETRKAVMDQCDRSMNDHRMIRLAGSRITAAQLLARHEESVMWLTDRLAEPFDGKTCVVSHHAPHPNSLSEWRHADYLKAAYASDLTALMDVPDLWLHGHVHTSSDYRVGNTRIMANPRGYPRNVPDREMRMFQNDDFNEQKTVDL